MDNQLTQDIDKLYNCTIAMQSQYNKLVAQINVAFGQNNVDTSYGKSQLSCAQKTLADLEDCIRRYHADLPQNFEEVEVKV